MTASAETPNSAVPPLTALLQAAFPQSVRDRHAQGGEETVIVRRQGMLDLFRFLRDDPRCAFDLMIDLTAVDHLPRTPRFEVVVHLKSLAHNHRLRVKIPIEEGQEEVDSISALWVAADWYERECFDMYGIRFAGHPDLRRLLLYPEFAGHPLRKDYDHRLQQPRVPLRAVRERHDYEMRVQYPEGVEKPRNPA